MSIPIHDRSTSIAVLVLCAFLFSLGCASGGGGDDESRTGSTALVAGRQVGQLSVFVGEGLAEDTTQIVGQFSILADLDSGVRRELAGQGWSDSGSLSVDVEIVELRVRSTASAIWMPASSAQSATRTGASAQTTCACCGRSGVPPC